MHSSLVKAFRHINSPQTNKPPIQDTKGTIHSFEDTNSIIHSSPSCSHIHNKNIETIHIIKPPQHVTIHAKNKSLQTKPTLDKTPTNIHYSNRHKKVILLLIVL